MKSIVLYHPFGFPFPMLDVHNVIRVIILVLEECPSIIFFMPAPKPRRINPGTNMIFINCMQVYEGYSLIRIDVRHRFVIRLAIFGKFVYKFNANLPDVNRSIAHIVS